MTSVLVVGASVSALPQHPGPLRPRARRWWPSRAIPTRPPGAHGGRDRGPTWRLRCRRPLSRLPPGSARAAPEPRPGAQPAPSPTRSAPRRAVAALGRILPRERDRRARVSVGDSRPAQTRGGAPSNRELPTSRRRGLGFGLRLDRRQQHRRPERPVRVCRARRGRRAVRDPVPVLERRSPTTCPDDLPRPCATEYAIPQLVSPLCGRRWRAGARPPAARRRRRAGGYGRSMPRVVRDGELRDALAEKKRRDPPRDRPELVESGWRRGMSLA